MMYGRENACKKVIWFLNAKQVSIRRPKMQINFWERLKALGTFWITSREVGPGARAIFGDIYWGL